MTTKVLDTPSIPIIDLSVFSTGSLSQRQKAAKSLTEACQTLGFTYITGYGISPSLLQEAFAWSKKLYDLPQDDKMKAPHPAAPMPHRGYSPTGLEKVYSKKAQEVAEVKEGSNGGASLREIRDHKESFEIGSEENAHQPNIWLPEEILPGFRAFMTKFYWELDKTAKMILEAMGLGLGLTDAEMKKLARLHSGQNNQLRLLHYPPIPAEKLEKKVVARMPPHQDWSSFTLLFQDDCGGLELEDPNNPGSFLPANPVPNALVLNIADMMQRFTNGNFPSAMHRVALPPLQERYAGEERITRERYSIPYFVAPDHDGLVDCLPSMVDEKHPAQYEPVVWSKYGVWRAKHSY